MAHRGEHLNEYQAACYLDGTLDEVERDQVEGHLAACDECRSELLSAARLVRSPRAKRFWYVAPPLAAGFVLALVLLVNPGAATDAAEPLIGLVEGGERLGATSPEDGAVIGAADAVLTWSTLEPAVTYEVAVVNVDGQVVWEVSATETSVAVPTGRLKAGRSYAWTVLARFENGDTARTEARTFVVRR